MADTVSSITIENGPTMLVRKFLNLSDGTGESGVKKVDMAAITGPKGLHPTSVIIEKIVYDVQGMKVQIFADGTSAVKLAILGGFGTMNLVDDGASGINSTNTGTGAGNLNFTTVGAAANSTYDITLFMRKVGG